jgi:[ribosomal protein S5]-alanine N-acetyltransferase
MGQELENPAGLCFAMNRFRFRTSRPAVLDETIIQSDRLRLVPTTEAHAEAIFKGFTEEVTTYMFPKPAERLEETLTFIRSSRAAMEAGENLQLTILSKTTSEFLGCCGLHGGSALRSRTPELGIWLKRGAHGRGYGKEAVIALVTWATEHLDLDGFVYPVDRRNLPSRKIPEALGGEIVATETITGLGGNALELVTYRVAAGPPDDDGRRTSGL